jgi:hypothetical protein
MVTLCRTLGFRPGLSQASSSAKAPTCNRIWLEVYQTSSGALRPDPRLFMNMPMNYVPVRRDSDQVSAANVDRSSWWSVTRSNDWRRMFDWFTPNSPP